MSLPLISPAEAQAKIAAGEALLVDIREPVEFARERIATAEALPLSTLPDAGKRLAGKTVIFTCRSGNRTRAQAGQLAALDCQAAYLLDGGLEGWKQAGLPVRLDRSQPIDLMRQVQIAAGGLVLVGLLLAWLVGPWFALLSAFVGAGLVFAGVSGFCGMARLLALLPWNRPATA